MGTESIVSGHIKMRSEHHVGQLLQVQRTKEALDAFTFDEVYPFTNIFWCDSPARYSGAVIAFAGSYKQIEEVWHHWLWKISQLLSTLDASEAIVTLDCIMGTYQWRLIPRISYDILHLRQKQDWPETLVGQQWGVIEAPQDDFSISPEWLKLNGVIDDAGVIQPYTWDKFVDRWQNAFPRISTE
jgi:hypothetical protein